MTQQYDLPPLPEPDAYLFQHEETGLTEYVDSQQVEWGFEKANPRWQKIHGAFTERQLETYARAAIQADRKRRGEPVAWAYEFHEFGDVWARHVILNRPDGGANPPTKHHGSAVRNVVPLYAAPQPADPSGAPTLRNADSGAQDGVQAPQPAEPVKVPSDGWDLAEKVRRDLDRQSCPDVYMRIAMESIVKHCGQPAQPERLIFPTHLRKMWSGSEVQAWLDEQMRVEPHRTTAKGSLERYRQWQAEQPAQPAEHSRGEPVKLCDCERGHNGMGMAGRECDCPGNNPQPAEPANIPSDELLDEILLRSGYDMKIDGFVKEMSSRMLFTNFAKELLTYYAKGVQPVPEGYVMIPLVPTEEMIESFSNATLPEFPWKDAPEDQKQEVREELARCLRTMYEVAPKPVNEKDTA